MDEHTAYVMFALERLKVCGPKMAILGKEGPLNVRTGTIRLPAVAERFERCEYCGAPGYKCVPHCPVETIEQGVKR